MYHNPTTKPKQILRGKTRKYLQKVQEEIFTFQENNVKASY